MLWKIKDNYIFKKENYIDILIKKCLLNTYHIEEFKSFSAHILYMILHYKYFITCLFDKIWRDFCVCKRENTYIL